MRAPICWDCCNRHGAGPFFGRLLIGLIFFLSGLGKIAAYDDAVAALTQFGVDGARVYIIFALIFEIVGGALLILGLYTRIAVWILVIFLIAATFIFHSFWIYEGTIRQVQLINFMKNLAIFGGLILVYSFGPGRWSLDARRFRKCAVNHHNNYPQGPKSTPYNNP